MMSCHYIAVDDRLLEIAKGVATDDYSHATRDPIFLVQQKIREYGFDGDYSDNNEWLSIDRQETIDGPRAKRLNALEANCREVPEKYTKVYYKDRWEFVTCCFTKDGAEAFIKRQKHNLKETRIWVDSLYRNQEMIDLRENLISFYKLTGGKA